MLTYTYKARNNAGELVSGDLTGETEQEIVLQLRQKGCTPIKISANVAAVKEQAKSKGFLSAKISFGTPSVKTSDLMMFCTNLSSMTNAGVPLLNALTITGDQLTNEYLSQIVRKVDRQISDGASFSQALSNFPKVFSNFIVNMVRAGEISGTLDKVLKELADYLENQDNLRQTVQGMLIYPTVLLVACIGVIVLMCTFLMPQFVTIFTKSGVPLPLPTQILYEIGIWIKKYPLYYVPALIGLFLGFKQLSKTKKGKEFLDRFTLGLPLVGSLINKSLIVRFCRTLATLLDTGVPILESFKILQQVIENVVYVGIIDEIYANVEKGEGIHTALIARKEFPRDVTYMISVGEKTGNIVMMLNKISDFYGTKVQNEVKGLMVLIEPTFIAIMGVVVGGIMASILLPMFDMIKTVQK